MVSVAEQKRRALEDIERRREESDLVEVAPRVRVPRKFITSGGVRRRAVSVGAEVERLRVEKERIAREKAERLRIERERLQAQRLEIERKQREANRQARLKFQRDLRTAKDKARRNFLRLRFNREVELARLKSISQRQRAGISKFVGRPIQKRVGVVVTKQSPASIRNQSVRDSVSFINEALKAGNKISLNEEGFLISSPSNLSEKNKLQQVLDDLSELPSSIQKKSLSDKINKRLEKLKVITKPFFKIKGVKELRTISKTTFNQLEKQGLSKEKIANIILFTKLKERKIDERKDLTQKQKDFIIGLSQTQKNVLVGGLEIIENEPEQIALLFAGGFIAPKLLAGLGATPIVIKTLSKIPPKVQKAGAVAITRFLQGAYLTSVGLRIKGQPTREEREKKLGGILVGEVAPFSIGTKIGVRGLMKNTLKDELDKALKGMSKSRQEAFKDYMKQAEVFGKYEPEARNIKLNNIENLPKGNQGKIAQDVIRKFLKDKDIIVGGSVAQTGQIKVGRKLGDIDGYKAFKVEGKNTGELKKLSKELEKKLTKAGVQRASSSGGQTTIAGKKSIEFHDISRIKANIQQVTPSWSNWRRYIIETPEGIRIQRIGLQARRKLVASFADPKRFATGKYKKDLLDFKVISNSIFRNAVRRSRDAFFFKKSKLKELEKIFKRKIPKLRRVKKVKVKKIKRVKVKKIKKVKRKPTKKKVKVKKPKLSKAELRKVRLASLKKARAKLKKIRKARPSQRPAKKIKKFKPSQPPRKPKKKFKPSQPPRKPTKRDRPSQPPRKPPRRKPPKRPPKFPPSQPPARPPKSPKFFPSLFEMPFFLFSYLP